VTCRRYGTLLLQNSSEIQSGAKAPHSKKSDPVCEFYTAHPYPPPVENLDRARDEWDENRRRAEFHLLWPNKTYRADLEVLVAGCGTWQAAKYALCHPQARVTGIDVSATSLDHTEKLKKKYNLTNLKTRRSTIEDLLGLDQHFDLIICTGVLHHLADPAKGLNALRSVLGPGGAIYLMLYAPYGRAGVYLLQDYCRRLGIGTSASDIKDLAAALAALPVQHPLASTLRGARESLSAEALADALLNPRDRAYSVPQLFDFIDGSGLKFGRWYWQAPYLPQCGSIASTPHAKLLANLPERERFAAMELWRGTMNAHSVLVYQEEFAGVRFDGESWRSYVPIRFPSTICVQERLPPGAAGVLLNRSHQFHDLILVIDGIEKSMFDAMDGRRSIAEIAGKAGDSGLFRARTFFEKLWWYDHAVFDASTN
jgi:SAM-dependent methyltransferase